ARIKKIMQMDEDVGKMAQATPVLVAKSLEMFMQSLIDRSCEETRFRNSKRMSSAHLKRCINANEQFDFLKDVVAAVPD
ncbi:histone-fold-containing protein, partial [Dimargaris cristalligena]